MPSWSGAHHRQRGRSRRSDRHAGTALRSAAKQPYRYKADIDADGRDELVSAEGWHLIRGWDPGSAPWKWSFNADLDIAALRLIDVTGDATPEIVYGDGQGRDPCARCRHPHRVVGTSIRARRHRHRGIRCRWRWRSRNHVGRRLVVERARLYVRARPRRHASIGMAQRRLFRPYSAVDIGDVDADGELELVVASYELQRLCRRRAHGVRRHDQRIGMAQLRQYVRRSRLDWRS